MGIQVSHAARDGLLERERELAVLDRLVDGVAGGGGRIALIEGPAGIGKTRLLAKARERAGGAVTVLGARCGQLERDFSFGTVRQLFESAAHDPARRERLLAGAAAPAGGVLDALGGDDGAAEGSFAVLHGLYWATLNLAEEQPVLLAIDDLQWSDRPSLRFIAYLARRLEGVPVLVAATLRSTDPGTDPGLLAEIAADPATESIRPGPLGEESVGELIRERLGADPDPAFAAACQEATGGNPLLLGQLLTALREDGARPTAAGAGAVREIGPRAVSRTVLLRLSRLPADAVAVAHAVAVLGESAGLPAVAALTGLDDAAAAAGARDLARADILRPEPPLGFVHPLVRDAVYGDLPAGDRELQHGRAAQVLRHAQASDEEVAAQLLHAPRRGDADAVALLRRAADGASRRGGPDSAVAYLSRALDEPPPRDERGDVLLELGLAEFEMNAPAAVEPPRGRARAPDRPGDARPGGVRARALAALHRPARPRAAALASADRPRPAARTRRPAPDHGGAGRARRLLRQLRPGLAGAHGRASRRRRGRRHGRQGAGRDDRVRVGGRRGPADRCEALALESLVGADLLASGGGLFWSAALVALILSDSPRTAEFLEAGREENYRRGSVFATSSLEMWTGLHQMVTGDLEEAGESLRHTLQLQEPWGSDPTGSSWARGLVAMLEFARGDVAGARATLGDPPPPEDESDGANLIARRPRGDDAGRRPGARGAGDRGADGPAVAARPPPRAGSPGSRWRRAHWRSSGRRDEAIAAMRAELEIARATGAASAIGRCLRELGELEGEAGIATLREAVEVLAASPARLEYARALAALGGALRRARQPTEAREPLRQSLELAEACGCTPLVDAVRSELGAAGARPRTSALGGVESLTARELRVAELAAAGRTNREVAQALFVTPKTVEVHLSNAYRKLYDPVAPRIAWSAARPSCRGMTRAPNAHPPRPHA